MTLNEIIKNTSRALIKRFQGLPNVSDFYTEKYGIHQYAAIYGIEKILRNTYAEKLVHAGPNRYLLRQYCRLTYYALNKEQEKFNRLSDIILRKSISFRILALNRTMKDWFTMKIRDLRRIWNSLSFIAKSGSSDLKFKRVWIDKKPGDYARPLGVPTPAWRCYSFMRLDHMEIYLKGSGRFSPWQHGGRSGVGVLSCYKMLIPKLKTANTIFEFDIKGFFDNISHAQIVHLFGQMMGNPWSKWLEAILKAKPTSYTLPPEEKDIGLKNYINLIKVADEVLWPWRNSSNYETHKIELIASWMREDPRDFIGKYKMPEGTRLEYLYKELMSDNHYHTYPLLDSTNFMPVKYAEPTQTDREKGRDRWKNLGQPGRGVPQGLGTSPFVSTFMTDSAFRNLTNNLIMYMDDGILYANSPKEMEESLKELNKGLEMLGLEMAPEKSKYVKKNGKWVDSLRFLGLRYLPKEDTLTSETRSGTKMKFPVTGEWPDIKELAAVNNMNVSMMKKTFDRLVNTKAYETGLEYGFLGCLIAGSQYKDNLSLREIKERVREGQAHSWAKITASQGFVWQHQDLHNHTECLTNMSSIACERFAEFHRRGYKFYIPKGGRITRRIQKRK